MKYYDVVLYTFVLSAFFMTLAFDSSSADAKDEPLVLIKTSLGDMEAKLFHERSSESVKNFLSYVDEFYYNNTLFHRVIPGFMIQGGGWNVNMVKLPTKPPIVNEASNGLLNRRGTLAMARTGAPHSATSQFFINVENNAFLDHKDKTPQGFGYTVFGEVTKGMDVVDAISKVRTKKATNSEALPVEPVVILSITRIEAE